MSQTQKQVGILRTYLKDLSFESPLAPAVFNGPWNPEVSVNLGVQHKQIDNQVYEVVLEMTIKGEKDGKTFFIVELEKAGLFRLENLSPDEMSHALGVFCPNILFPYARQIVDQSLLNGSFPPLMLAPINFEALYAQQRAGKGNALS